MDHYNHNTEVRTNKHLNSQERFYLEKRLQAGDSISAIAKALGRSRTTIYTEIRRGTTTQIKQDQYVAMYFADHGQIVYEESRKGSFNQLRAGAIELFLSWVEEKVHHQKWSLDAAAGYAKHHALFPANEMVCTKTLYNYVHLRIISITPMDLPQMLRRSTRKRDTLKQKRVLGNSIDKRDPMIETREEFGHWELDTVRGIKDKTDDVIVTVLERKSRFYVTLRSPSAKAVDVKETLSDWLNTMLATPQLSLFCKTMTADNGSEFVKLSELETEELLVYFAHAYSAWERGSNERHNGLLRRFIPKGVPIKNISDEAIKRAMNWCNNLPRKLLGYRTPFEVFFEEMRKLVDLKSVQFDIAI